MNKSIPVVFLPLDNRPVSFLLPQQIASFSGINLLLPEKKFLGDLNKGSDLTYIDSWLKNLASNSGDLALPFIVSLDNYVYGGLIQSRKHEKKMDELKKRVYSIKKLSTFRKYSFSSVLRISNTSSKEEEKDYWKGYGKEIFKWSELTYKVGRGIKEKGKSHDELIEEWYQASKLIPPEILLDYKSHRDKNFFVNISFFELLHDSCFHYLLYACDDSGEYGVNLVEAEYLKDEIKKHNFSVKASIVNGTDEIPLLLLAKVNLELSAKKPRIFVMCDSKTGKDQKARYEANSIYRSVLNQIEVLNIELSSYEESDIVLVLHVSDSMQGDHIFGICPDDTKNNVKNILEFLSETEKPFILLDLAYANGADPNLIKDLLSSNLEMDNCYAYSGWNTCSNTTGSALSIGINRWVAEVKDTFNVFEFKKCLLTRFLDDYAYQAVVRHKDITEEEINDKMKTYVSKFSRLIGIDNVSPRFTLPWKRPFEIEIEF